MKIPARIALLFVLLHHTGCVVSLKINDDTQLSCDALNGCPEGFRCAVNLSRCVPLNAVAAAPVSIADVTLNADVFAAGTTLEVRLRFDGELSGEPTLILQSTPPLQIPFASKSDDTFVFTRSLDVVTSDGVYPLVVSYADASGNHYELAATGANVRLDFSPPTIVSTSTDTLLPVGSGGQIELTLISSEVLPTPPLVTLDTGEAFALVGTTQAPIYSFSLAVTDAATAGTHTVSAAVIDAAGNAQTTKLALSFMVDHMPPTVVSTSLFGSPATLNTAIGTRLHFSEPLHAAPTVSLVGPDAIVRPVSTTLIGADYVASISVDSGFIDGTYALTLDAFSDSAANAGEASGLGTLEIDTTAPLVTSAITSSISSLSHASGHDSTSISFHLSEDVGTEATGIPRLEVRAGSTLLTCSRTYIPGDAAYTCNYAPTASDVDGSRQVAITAMDAAGNLAFATGPVLQLDFVAPAFAVAPTLTRSDLFTRAQITPSSLYLNQDAVDGSGQPTVAIVFATNEVLSADPEFSLPGVVIESSSTGGFFVARYTPQFPLSEGPHTLSATLTDPAGNSSTLVVGTINIDTVPPVLDATAIAGITYYRSLWDAPPNGTPLVRLDITQPLEANATLFVYDGDSYFTSGLIGTFDPTAGPLTTVPLPSANRSRVYVALRDRAGNRHGSAPKLVKKGRFITTLIGDVVDPYLQNPQICTADRTAGPGLAGSFSSPVFGASTLDSADANTLNVVAENQDVLAVSAGMGGPSDRSLPAMAVVDDGPLVLFGGRKNTPPITALADTWLFDGTRWISASGGPPPRYQAGMSRKTGMLSQGRTVLFGGTNGSASLCDTWRWDGNTWLQNLNDDQCTCGVGTCPTARFAHAQSFAESFDLSPFSQSTIITGGVCAGDVSCDDMRINTIDAGFDSEWLAPVALAPYEINAVSRAYHALAYAGSPVSTLFSFGGGRSNAGNWSADADLWSWHGAQWTQLCSASLVCETSMGPAPCSCTQSPPARFSPTFYVDERRHRLVMLGGTSDRAGNNRLRDVWAWSFDGPGDWQQIHDFSACPGASTCEWLGQDDAILSQGSFARDLSRHVTWRFGGAGGMMTGGFVMLSDRRYHTPALQIEIDWSIAGVESSPQTVTVEATAAASSEIITMGPPPQPDGQIIVEALRQDAPRRFEQIGSGFAAMPLDAVSFTAQTSPVAYYTLAENQHMFFRLRPGGSTGNAASGAEIRVDTLRFVFDYEL